MTNDVRTYPHSTGGSSLKYGPCEVCGASCAEVFITRKRDDMGDCVFGHDECLRRVGLVGQIVQTPLGPSTVRVIA